MEYLTAALISVIVLYAGVTSLVESVKKLIHPQTPEYTTVSLVIIAVAVVVKIVLGRYVKGVGEKVKSDSLVASGQDATLDSVISASTLVAAIIFLLSGLSLEAWLGAVISLIIIKSGIEMLSDTLSQILGRRADSELARSVKDSVLSFDEVHGAYDLILHNYGPDYYIGSVHVEVDDTLTAEQLDPLERAIAQKVYQDNGVILTGVGIYAKNTKDDEAARLHDEIRRVVMARDYVLQMHGFYLNEAEKTIQFDVVLDFEAPDEMALYAGIVKDVQAIVPDYKLVITPDKDITD